MLACLELLGDTCCTLATDSAGLWRPGKENEHNNANDSAAKEQRLLKEQAMSSITFVELLFWKNTRDAEEVRQEYGWKVPVSLMFAPRPPQGIRRL